MFYGFVLPVGLHGMLTGSSGNINTLGNLETVEKTQHAVLTQYDFGKAKLEICKTEAELFSRWFELGVFSPFFRAHSVIDSKPREPRAFDSARTEINREIIE